VRPTANLTRPLDESWLRPNPTSTKCASSADRQPGLWAAHLSRSGRSFKQTAVSLRAVLFLVVSLMPASADVRIEASPGGEATSFIHFFEALRQTHERVVIDGPCFSACTLVLIVIPRSRICVTQRAVLGFHAARAFDEHGLEYPAPEVTREVADAYPARIRYWIKRHGGLTRAPIFLSGRELADMYPRCR
jgi:hypothetical protein